MYEKVFSPEGEMFEVHPNRVAYLILDMGWTRSKVETRSEPEPEPEPEPDYEELGLFDEDNEEDA